MNHLNTLASWLFKTLAEPICSFIIASRTFTLAFCFLLGMIAATISSWHVLLVIAFSLLFFAELLQRV